MQGVENDRLREKLFTAVDGSNTTNNNNNYIVGKVYLQFGTDLTRLRRGLEYIHQLTATATNGTAAGRKTGVGIAGSIFLPTASLIAQQRFRPWNGVYLSDEFLSGPAAATEIVAGIVRVYNEFRVEILWEAPGIRDKRDM